MLYGALTSVNDRKHNPKPTIEKGPELEATSWNIKIEIIEDMMTIVIYFQMRFFVILLFCFSFLPSLEALPV